MLVKANERQCLLLNFLVWAKGHVSACCRRMSAAGWCRWLSPGSMETPSARRKGEKEGKNIRVGSYYAPADGGKGINRSFFLSLARRN